MKLSFLIATASFLVRIETLRTQSTPTCPEYSAKNIPIGTINVNTNTGWYLGGWGFASPYNKANYGDKENNWGTSNYGYGNFGSYNQGNGNFGTGNLGNDNLGNYNVGQDNCGSYNMGNGNVGQYNVGIGNNGTLNLGINNLGGGNTGIDNNGTNNVGASNLGYNNVGLENSGSSNFGINNEGTENVGWDNQGNWNIGSTNDGNGNVGGSNSGGNWNIGFLNSGSNNTGGWNYGTGNTGYLSGVQNSSIPLGLQINWQNVQVNELNDLTAVNQTGWNNLNTSNAGIAQSGFHNVGFSNVGNVNIGSNNNGTDNTGINNIGTQNIGVGFAIGSGVGPEFVPVTINGLQSSSTFGELLNSSVYGYVSDNIITPYPFEYQDAMAAALEIEAIPLSTSSCQSYAPMAIYNTFSFSIRCRGSVKITDLYCSGDSFAVYKNGKLWFVTPVVSLETDPYCLRNQRNPEEAFYDPEFSHELGWLQSGSYSISVVPTSSRWGGGAVAIKVDDFCDRVGLGKYQRF